MRPIVCLILVAIYFFGAGTGIAMAQINAPREDSGEVGTLRREETLSLSRVLLKLLDLLDFGGEVASPLLLGTDSGINAQPYPVFVAPDSRVSDTGARGEAGSMKREESPGTEGGSVGVVWGAKIDRASVEVGSWLEDRNILVSFLITVGLVGSWALAKVGRRIWRWMLAEEKTTKLIKNV